MTPLNILIFEPYPMSNEGGNLRTQSYILEFIDKTQFNPIVLAPFESKFTNRIRKQGIQCIIIKPPQRVLRYGGECLRDNFADRFLTMLDMVSYNLKLLSIVKKKKIDVIYSNCIRAVLSIGLAAKLSRTPHLLYIKGELQNRLLDMIGFVLANKLVFLYKTNINDKYPKLIKLYKAKIDVVGNGINPQVIIEIDRKNKSKLKEELSLDDQKINVIVLGQLYRPKGIHYLIEALSLLVGEIPNVMLYIVGDHVIDEYKNYRDELLYLIEQKRLKRNVVFTGWRTDALEILSLMDILVCPSLSEGGPFVVLEAMSFGKAVIATSVGGSREIIKEGENGFLVKPGSSREIAEKLSLLLKDHKLRERFGKNARKTVFPEHLIHDKIRRLEHIFIEMAKAGSVT